MTALHEEVYASVAKPIAAAVSLALQRSPATANFRGILKIVVDKGQARAQDVTVELRQPQRSGVEQ